MSFFHYTDANAVLSMIQNTELWLTDIRFMNDAEESLDGTKYVKNAISDLLLENDLNSDRALERLHEFDEQYVKDGQLDEHAFVCSFSKTPDHLVQWRSYGLYAVEFHESLEGDLKDFYPCFYEEHTKKHVAAAFVANIRMAIAAEYQRGEGDWSDAVMDKMWKLADFVNQFKHQSFRDENEVRLIHLMNSHARDINYRARGGLIVPYLKVKFKLEHVKAIHIGPMKNQDLAVLSMSSFLHNLEINNWPTGQYGEYRIKIIPSAIPYRQI